MKFKFDIEKKNARNIGTVHGHNHRLHATASQLPERAWFNAKGTHTLVPWRAEVLDQARKLAKRKDAVFGVEISIQVGNQVDWRDPPDETCPEGKPKRGNTAKMNALLAGAREALKAEIGADRIISAVLHMDESTPHVQVVFAPVLDGKLNAKHWVGGHARCAQFRERIYKHINAHLPCDYEKGVPGGAEHDASKRAGKQRATDAEQVAKIKALEQQVQTLFSQLKAEQKKALKLKADYDDFTLKTAARLQAQQAELERLRPRPQRVIEQRDRRAETDSQSDQSAVKPQKPRL